MTGCKQSCGCARNNCPRGEDEEDVGVDQLSFDEDEAEEEYDSDSGDFDEDEEEKLDEAAVFAQA